jgi:hypothetical protein
MNTIPSCPAIAAPSSDGEPSNQSGPNDGPPDGCPPDARHLAALRAVQTLAAQAAELRKAAGGSLTEALAVSVAASLTVAWLQPAPAQADAAVPENPQWERRDGRDGGVAMNPQSAIRNPQSQPAASVEFQRVKEFAPLLGLLRRGDQYAEWLQIQRQWHALATAKHQNLLAAQKAKTDSVPRQLRDDGGFTKDVIEKTVKALNMF